MNSKPVICRCKNGHTWTTLAWVETFLVSRACPPRNPWDLKRMTMLKVSEVQTHQDRCETCGEEWEEMTKPCNHTWRQETRVDRKAKLEELQSALGL